jgi:hypothetical protein
MSGGCRFPDLPVQEGELVQAEIMIARPAAEKRTAGRSPVANVSWIPSATNMFTPGKNVAAPGIAGLAYGSGANVPPVDVRRDIASLITVCAIKLSQSRFGEKAAETGYRKALKLAGHFHPWREYARINVGTAQQTSGVFCS